MATTKQLVVREAFKNCTRCFANQPESGGVEPPEFGPRSREWWYDNNDGMWYYNNFIQDSIAYYLQSEWPPWCRSGLIPIPIHYWVDQKEPSSNFGNTTAAFLGAWQFGGSGPYYIRRGFISLDLSAITKEDAAKSHSIVLLFTYKNAFHPLDPPLPPAIPHGFYYVPVSGELPTRSWNNQFGMSTPKTEVLFQVTLDSTEIFTALKITSKYKELIEDEETHLNLGIKADNESGTNYPYGPMTLYYSEILGQGSDMVAFLSFS